MNFVSWKAYKVSAKWIYWFSNHYGDIWACRNSCSVSRSPDPCLLRSYAANKKSRDERRESELHYVVIVVELGDGECLLLNKQGHWKRAYMQKWLQLYGFIWPMSINVRALHWSKPRNFLTPPTPPRNSINRTKWRRMESATQPCHDHAVLRAHSQCM